MSDTQMYSSDVAFTPAVKQIQARKGSRDAYARIEQHGAWRTEVDENLAAFLAEGAETPVFARFSPVLGSRGSADTVRDTRGFAVKFYTEEGVFDRVIELARAELFPKFVASALGGRGWFGLRRHQQIEHDQGVAIPPVQLADFVRIPGGRDGSVTGPAQHLHQQSDIDLQIVHDQDAGLKNVR